MIRKYLPIFLLCIFTIANAQAPINKISEALESKLNSLSASDEILVWVYFTDKGNNTNAYFSNPQSVVSEKSITRREKVLGKYSPLTIKDIPVYSEYISLVKLNGLKLKWPSKWLNAVSGTITKENIEQVASLPFVKKLDIVYKLRKENEVEFIQNDLTQKPENIEQPVGVNSYNYGSSYAQMQQINVPAVHDSGFTGQGVTICVMDAGFNRLTHDAFLSMNIIAAWDFVNNDPNVGNQSDMGEGSHGTMTLSTIGGYASGNLIGPAFNSTYILAKTENTDSETPIEEDNWIAAMEWADSIGVDVTSTSLGYIGFDPPYTGYTWQDMDGNTTVITNGADYAAYIGIVVVNSAGNEGYNSTHNTLGAPSDGDSVIAAGAVTISGTRSSFSSVGPTVDGRIKPDIMALGSNDVVASPYGDHSYTTASGTSFSCPLSAGVAALILCSNPNLTPMQVRDAMRNTASKSNNPDNLYGWGILNALAAIYYFPPPPTTFQLTVNLANGWNMVSIPGLHPINQNVQTWWPGMDPSASVFRYNSGYQEVTVANPGEGYWIKQLGAQTYNTGDEWPAGGIQVVTNDPIPIHTGWNLISVYECPVDAALLTTTPPGLQVGLIYGYSSGYIIANTLYPGYAYWFKSLGEGFLNIPNCSLLKSSAPDLGFIKEDWGKIIFTDAQDRSYTLYSVNSEVDLNKFELPPVPPSGMFDIRFGSGRLAENLFEGFKEIELRSVEYPVSIKTENIDIKLQDETGQSVNIILKDGEEVEISDASIMKLMVIGEIIPAEYSLEQNYPNPFNPSTTIEFSLPEDVNNVKLSVYNTLGEKITELVNSSLAAGKHSFQWNAQNAATGFYIYELRTEEYSAVKKMLLIK